MASAHSKSVRFKYPMEVQVKRADFRPLSSIAALDLSRLSKGNHRIEVGFATGGCCEKAVYAVIRHGMVTDIQFEVCEESKAPVTKELLALLRAARGKLKMATPSKWRPIPAAEFLKSPALMSRLIISWSNWCLQVCIEWGGALHCYYCCAWPPMCGSDTIATGKL